MNNISSISIQSQVLKDRVKEICPSMPIVIVANKGKRAILRSIKSISISPITTTHTFSIPTFLPFYYYHFAVDVPENRQVTTQEGINWAGSIPLLETSAKTGENVEQIFHSLVSKPFSISIRLDTYIPHSDLVLLSSSL